MTTMLDVAVFSILFAISWLVSWLYVVHFARRSARRAIHILGVCGQLYAVNEYAQIERLGPTILRYHLSSFGLCVGLGLWAGLNASVITTVERGYEIFVKPRNADGNKLQGQEWVDFVERRRLELTPRIYRMFILGMLLAAAANTAYEIAVMIRHSRPFDWVDVGAGGLTVILALALVGWCRWAERHES